MPKEFEKVRTQFILSTFENNDFSPMTVSVQYLGHQLPRWLHSSFISNLPVPTQFLLGCCALQKLPDLEDF